MSSDYNQFYIKKNGKYVKYNDTHAYEGLGPGAWLVVVNEGCTSIRSVIDPKLIELDAALYYLREGLCVALSEASKMKPQSTPLTEKEKKAWAQYEKIMGDDMPKMFSMSSFDEISHAGTEYVKKELLKHKMDVNGIKKEHNDKKKENEKKLDVYKNPISSLEL